MPQVPVNVKPQGSLLERITQVRVALDDTVRQAKFMGGQVQLDISVVQTLLLFIQEVAREIEQPKEKEECGIVNAETEAVSSSSIPPSALQKVAHE